MPADPSAIVRSLLDTANLTVSDEEFARFVAVYPAVRAQADELHQLPEIASLDPALSYDPTAVRVAHP
jgi:hypothetical protein